MDRVSICGALLLMSFFAGCADEVSEDAPPAEGELREDASAGPDDKALDSSTEPLTEPPAPGEGATQDDAVDELDAALHDGSSADAAAGDAAPGAGGSDGSVRDAGDASVDAATRDAGSLDAGSDAAVDAGPRDAGAKDAASPYDASFVEAGSPGATTFTRVYAILGSRCRSCHTPGAETDLNWTSKQRAYETLVRGGPDYQTSTYPICASGGHKRVVPYQPEASLLYTKLARTQPCGSPMPIATAFEPELLPEIRSWILDGALNN